MINDLEDELKYPEELYLVVELSDSILELTEKLERVRVKLDDFEQRYLEADKELGLNRRFVRPGAAYL